MRKTQLQEGDSPERVQARQFLHTIATFCADEEVALSYGECLEFFEESYRDITTPTVRKPEPVA